MMPSPELKIAILQIPLAWEAVNQNLEKIEQQLDAITHTDIVLLPEMFSTGFSMNRSLAQAADYAPLQWMINQSQKYGFALAGSYMIHEEDKYYNRFSFVYPDGKVCSYNKKHLFGIAEESHYFTPGSERVMLSFKGWRVALFVCYDLRFPVWNRRTPNFDYDLVLYSANWPERRSLAWRSLLPARAIENQSFVAAANRIGLDGHHILHSGDSMILSPIGKPIAVAPAFTPIILEATLRYDTLEQIRQNLPFFNDRDSFTLN